MKVYWYIYSRRSNLVYKHIEIFNIRLIDLIRPKRLYSECFQFIIMVYEINYITVLFGSVVQTGCCNW